MQSGRGLPPAPASLPVAPHLRQGANNHETQQNHANWPTQGALAAQAVTAALANPYSQTYTTAGYNSGYISSHYAQAYIQTNWPATNPEGYTLSSTYVPGMPGSSCAMPQGTDYPPKNGGPSRPTPQYLPSQGQGSWYQFGHSRCTYKDCIFTGSQKSVEIHMMDRHLIYPPGWDKRKKQSDWDADPSLKGKPIPIQGTTVNLDDPEVLEAWIAERKKRWPSAHRVEEKKRKLDEAISRGQISVDDPGLLKGKRRRLNDERGANQRGGRGEGGRGRGRGRGRGTDGGWRGRGRGGSSVQMRNDGPSATSQVVIPLDPDTSSDSGDDAPPEMVTSKPPPGLIDHESSSDHEPEDVAPKLENTIPMEPGPSQIHLQSVKKPRPSQPKKTPYNPFASRPTLLRNLLLPEIRITVSNLSQAIRFLVDNDFLKDVEMKPGQADEKLIEVIGDSAALPDQK